MRIIYVDVDTLRADHTQPYGYRRPLPDHGVSTTTGASSG